jgi:hypothetical protein
MALEELIVAWSQERPAWQREVMRRVAAGETFSEEDYDSLVEVIVEGKELPTGHFGLEQLPQAASEDVPVCLVAIEKPEHVNALESKEPLTFEPQGLTIVYGDNGSGKSGYRVTPQLQVPLVARPRSQRYLQGEVIGFRRPLRLYGGPEHGRQVPPQLNLKRLSPSWSGVSTMASTRPRSASVACGRLSGSRSVFASSVTFVRYILAILDAAVGVALRRRRVWPSARLRTIRAT